MTKRMLSLLLALVMTLSLCVPALAADEFEAETVTEVVEQAPEAPVEPEAPEAEVVEEPAVEEEAVEAPEAAAALVVEEEENDVPLLVKLGAVTKEAHYRLYNDVEVANTYKAGVEAGELRSVNFTVTPKSLSDALANYIKDPKSYDPFVNATGNKAKEEDFLSVLADAEYYLDGIDGVDVASKVGDVDTGSVEAIAEKLEAFLPDGKAELVDHILDKDELKEVIKKEDLRNLITANWHKHYDDAKIAASCCTITAINSDTKDPTVTTAWTKAYQMNYLEALEDALEAYEKLDATVPSYADYVAATKAAMDALVLETTAWKPGDAELTKVQAAIAAAPQDENIYNTTRFVLDINNTTKQPWNTFTSKTVPGYLGAVKALLSDKTTTTVKFVADTTLWEVNNALDTLAQYTKVAGEPTIEFVDGSDTWSKTADSGNVTVEFAVDYFPGSVAADQIVDGYQYAIAYHVKRGTTDKWVMNPPGTDDYKENEDPPAAAYIFLIGDTNISLNCSAWQADGLATQKQWIAELTLPVKNSLGTAFQAGDEVTIHYYYNKDIQPSAITSGKAAAVANAEKWEEIDSITFTIGEREPEKSLNYGKFSSANYVVTKSWTIDPYPTTRTPNTLVGFNPLSGSKEALPSIYLHVASSTAIKFADATKDGRVLRAALVDGDGKLVSAMTADLSKTASWQLTAAEDAALKVGTYYAVLQYSDLVNGEPDGDWVTLENSKAPVKILALSKWSSGETYASSSTVEGDGTYIKNALSILKAAKALDPMDYEIRSGCGKYLEGDTEEEKIAGAFDLIDDAISAMTTLLNDKTAGSTVANHNNICQADNDVVNSIGDIIKVCSYLKKKTADLKPLAEKIAEAEKLVGKTSQTQDEGTPVYTFNTYGKLKATMKEAEAIYKKGAENAFLSEIKKIIDTLDADIKALAPIDEIDKTELEASIKAAEACKEADYTVATWRPFETALANAKKVLADPKATQAQMKNAAELLTAAYNKLVMTDEAKAAKELAAAKEALAAAVKAAEEYKEADYTAESWKTFKDALDNAKALGDSATKADVEAAQKALEAAEKALEKKPATTPDDPKPTIPAAPASGTGWVKATDGTWYYYKDKVLQKSKWIYGKGGLWYYVGPDGAMWTGFRKIGNAWFMLQTGTEGGTQGKLVTSKNGWINDPAIPGDAYARTDRNSGHFGEITWTAAYGDFVNGHFTKGDPAA